VTDIIHKYQNMVCSIELTGKCYLHYSEKAGFHVKSAKEIPIAGETIFENFPFSFSLLFQFWGEKCCWCLNRSTQHMMQCSRCKIASYCGRKCQKQDWSNHKHECTNLIRYASIYTAAQIDDILLLHRVYKGLTKAGACCEFDQGGTLRCGMTHMTSLSRPKHMTLNEESLKVVDEAARELEANSTDIYNKLVQFRANNFGIMDPLLQCIGSGVYPAAALLNHSCIPNCVLTYRGVTSLSNKGPLLQVR